MLMFQKTVVRVFTRQDYPTVRTFLIARERLKIRFFSVSRMRSMMVSNEA